jgi:hypothetical protein
VDAVSLTGTAAACYNSKDVATANLVTFGGLSLTGTGFGNYSLTASTQAATITVKALTYSGLSVPPSKVYDGTKNAVVSGTAALQTTEPAGSGTTSDGKPYDVDVVSLTGTATACYNSKDVPTANLVTFGGLSLTGTGFGNYSLTATTQVATITPKALTYSGLSVPANKVYDGTPTAVVSGTAALQSAEAAGAGSTADGKPYSVDSVGLTGTPTAAYNTKDVATANLVTFGGVSLTGNANGDYTLTALTQAATITPKALTYSGLTVPASKVYDGTTTGVVNGTAALQSAEAAGTGTTSDGKPYSVDSVGLTGTATACYNSKDVAAATTVTFAGLSLTGNANGDYTLTALTQAATITPKALTYSGPTVPASKVYDGTTTAVVSGTAALQSAEAAGAGSTADGKPYTVDSVGLTGTLTAAYNTKDVATANVVTFAGVCLTGNANGNYTLTALTRAATITSKALFVVGLSANNKCFDGNTTATLSGTAALLGAETAGAGSTTDGKPYTGDTVSLSSTAGSAFIGTFASNGPGDGLNVGVSGNSLTGAQANDYKLVANEQSGLTANINVPPTANVDYNTQSVPYGCSVMFTVSASDPDSAAASLVVAATNYTFNGGSPIQGLPNGIFLVPAGTATWQVTGGAQAPVGTYVITVAVQDQCGAQGTVSFTLNVTSGTVTPLADSFYTGPTFYWTSGSGSSSATLTLMATLKDAGTCLGDIRTAKVSFYVRDPVALTLTPINGAQNLPVGLVNPGDTTTGTASANVQYNIGNSSAATLQIAVVVGGNYAANNPTTDQMITIAVPVPGGQICGGGTMNNAADFGSSGMLKGSANDPACFSFYVQYNKGGSNPQGSVQIFDKSYYKTDGTLDTVLHTYMFKSTSISVLSVLPGNSVTNGIAQFTSKANVIEILANGTESSIEGNDVMSLSLTDYSTMTGNMKPNTIGITINRSKGGTWYSSDWNGTKTVEKMPASGTISIK